MMCSTRTSSVRSTSPTRVPTHGDRGVRTHRLHVVGGDLRLPVAVELRRREGRHPRSVQHRGARRRAMWNQGERDHADGAHRHRRAGASRLRPRGRAGARGGSGPPGAVHDGGQRGTVRRVPRARGARTTGTCSPWAAATSPRIFLGATRGWYTRPASPASHPKTSRLTSTRCATSPSSRCRNR